MFVCLYYFGIYNKFLHMMIKNLKLTNSNYYNKKLLGECSMIYLIRHMQSEANLRRIWGGDYPLTDKGVQDAQKLKEQINFKPDILIVSPLIRAQQTAKILFPNIKATVESAFREIHFGDYEDTPMQDDEFSKIYKTATSHLHEISHGDVIKERADKAIIKLLDYLPYKTATVVCHDTLIRSIICRLKGESLDEMPKYKPLLPNGSVLKLDLSAIIEITNGTDKIIF